MTIQLSDNLTPRVQVENREAASYPGLQNCYMFYFFEVNLPDEHFNPEGYVERQPDKSTYFVWQSTD